MIGILKLILAALCGLFKSRARLEAENTYLRHQLGILRRKAPDKITLYNWERLVFVWFYRLCPSLLESTHIVNPQTLVRWHRQGFRAYWRWKSFNQGGRPRLDKDLRKLIREMSLANPLWGAPRIHGELLKLGFDVSQTTVANYMVKCHRPPSQTWKTFLHNHAEGLASIDFLVVPTVGFRLLYCLVILRNGTRRLVHFGVTSNPTAEWIARQITEAFPWDEAPDYLIRDNDGAYGRAFTKRLYAMGIRDRPTAPRSPWQNGYVERLIGSIRRECLDHLIVFNEVHLRGIMKRYADYYNQVRTHLALNKNSPSNRPIEHRGVIRPLPILGGLHHRYCRIE
jgi:transposase InsO family protein